MSRWAWTNRIPLSWKRSVIAVVAATVVGGSLGVALGQTVGAVDVRCVADCAERGLGEEYCTRSCEVPPDSFVPADQEFDWVCMRSCRARDGSLRDCLSRCQRRR